MTNALTIFNQLRPHTIGYDDIFDHFNDMFESSGLQTNYPPYDIIKQDDTKYDIQVALAGYSKEDITVEVKENTLSIKSVKQQDDDKVEVQDIDVKVEDAELVVETIVKKVKLEIKENV